ncbi:MAG: hypothetical protein IJP92_06245, partial [Lachnospiraceae bacterium]|nr:hypothetical protein [Lachnospiraceae bacterium]
MNPSQYAPQIKELIEEYLELQRTHQKDAWRVLDLLKKRAARLDDNALHGFICYQYAYMHCYGGGDYRKVRKYLTDTVHYLLRSDDRELLAKTYNFIAADAHDNGVYDIAYSYYLTSLYQDTNREFSGNSALVEANLGRLFFQLGSPELARKHLRRGIRQIREEKGKPMQQRNLIALHLNDAFVSLALEDLPAAKRSLQKILKICEKSDALEISDTMLTLLFLRVRIALLEKDTAAARNLLKQTVTALKKTPDLYEYADDIFD